MKIKVLFMMVSILAMASSILASDNGIGTISDNGIGTIINNGIGTIIAFFNGIGT